MNPHPPEPRAERRARPARRAAILLLTLVASVAIPARAGDAEGVDATLRALSEGRIVSARDVGTGVTFPLLLELEHEGRSLRGVFKDIDLHAPHRGEGPDPHVADRWKHEVAAYRLDRLIGLGLVPPTVVRERQGRQGSLQLWIEETWTLAESGREEPAELRRVRRAFDALVFNPDRNPDNILVAREGEGVWLIDHSRAFRALARFPYGLGSAPIELPDPLRAGIEALSREVVEAQLGELLAPEQIDALLARRELLLAEPGDGGP